MIIEKKIFVQVEQIAFKAFFFGCLFISKIETIFFYLASFVMKIFIKYFISGYLYLLVRRSELSQVRLVCFFLLIFILLSINVKLHSIICLLQDYEFRKEGTLLCLVVWLIIISINEGIGFVFINGESDFCLVFIATNLLKNIHKADFDHFQCKVKCD